MHLVAKEYNCFCAPLCMNAAHKEHKKGIADKAIPLVKNPSLYTLQKLF
jgi:hypothetical protein